MDREDAKQQGAEDDEAVFDDNDDDDNDDAEYIKKNDCIVSEELFSDEDNEGRKYAYRYVKYIADDLADEEAEGEELEDAEVQNVKVNDEEDSGEGNDEDEEVEVNNKVEEDSGDGEDDEEDKSGDGEDDEEDQSGDGEDDEEDKSGDGEDDEEDKSGDGEDDEEDNSGDGEYYEEYYSGDSEYDEFMDEEEDENASPYNASTIDQSSPVPMVRSVKTTETLPLTPFMQRLGYGTGVQVIRVKRTLNPGVDRSPWAIKMLCPRKETPAAINERLIQEAEILRKLNHPNIVGFRGHGEITADHTYLAMEYCSLTLGNVLEERFNEDLGPLEVPIASKVVLNILSALVYLHNEALLIHGDIKSYNVLIKNDFEVVKLCDFGVSLKVTPDGKIDQVANPGAHYIGTSLWLPPEMLPNSGQEHHAVSTKSDMFAFGLLVYEMLVCTPPHTYPGLQDDYVSYPSEVIIMLHSSSKPAQEEAAPVPRQLEMSVTLSDDDDDDVQIVQNTDEECAPSTSSLKRRITETSGGDVEVISPKKAKSVPPTDGEQPAEEQTSGQEEEDTAKICEESKESEQASDQKKEDDQTDAINKEENNDLEIKRESEHASDQEKAHEPASDQVRADEQPPVQEKAGEQAPDQEKADEQAPDQGKADEQAPDPEKADEQTPDQTQEGEQIDAINKEDKDSEEKKNQEEATKRKVDTEEATVKIDEGKVKIAGVDEATEKPVYVEAKEKAAEQVEAIVPAENEISIEALPDSSGNEAEIGQSASNDENRPAPPNDDEKEEAGGNEEPKKEDDIIYTISDSDDEPSPKGIILEVSDDEPENDGEREVGEITYEEGVEYESAFLNYNHMGTRPPIPSEVTLGPDYQGLLAMFFACTEPSPLARPSATTLLKAYRQELGSGAVDGTDGGGQNPKEPAAAANVMDTEANAEIVQLPRNELTQE